jgi:tRNA A-37 threonylcarbamoyl transferase component Bud32
MMTAIMQCPNTACGRFSHLGDDPLGRIFRCPRCLMKLPSASTGAADAGWTAVLGRPRLGNGRSGFTSWQAYQGTSPISGLTRSQSWDTSIPESGEVLVDALGIEGESSNEHDLRWNCSLGPDDSSEVLIEPFVSSGRSNSRWAVKSTSSKFPNLSDSGLAAIDLAKGIGSELGRFRIHSLLGEGEHAAVYRAYDPVLERDVALKVPRQGVLKTAKAIARFLGEARALARLRHPRIVPVYEAGRAGERHYIAMALIEGQSLADELANRPIACHRAAQIVAELAEALAYAHTEGIIHRDVKPANIRVDNNGDVYLMDFGIAYRPDSGEVSLPPHVILGTPAYLAPEQAQGGQTDVLPASDQYSLGVVFYELLCGQPPFSGPPSYVLFHTIHHVPSSPRTIAPLVPRALAAICLKALAKNPERRYRDCEHFAEDLRRWLNGGTPRAYRHAWRAGQ